MFGTVNGNFWLFLIFPLRQFFFIILRKIYRYWKFPETGFTCLVFSDLEEEQRSSFLFLAMTMWTVISFFSFLTLNNFCFDGTEIFSCVHVSQLSSQFFLPWCNSNGLNLSPVNMINRITLKSQFMFSVKPILSSKLAKFRFFRLCITRSNTCSLSELYSFSKFSFLRSSF